MKIKELKQFIQEANPEIIAMTDDQLQLQGLANYFHEAGHSEALRAVNMACDKPGRPITLFDIKHCLIYNGYSIKEFCEIAELWESPDNLDEQSDELKEKLYEYVKKNKNN